MTATATASHIIADTLLAGTANINRAAATSGDGLAGPGVCSNPAFVSNTTGWVTGTGAAITRVLDSIIGPSYTNVGRLAIAAGASGPYAYIPLAAVQPDLSLSVNLLVYAEGGGAVVVQVGLYDPTNSVLQTGSVSKIVRGDPTTIPVTFAPADINGYAAPLLRIDVSGSTASTIRFVFTTCQPPGDSSIYVGPATTPGYVSNFSANITGWTALLGPETLSNPATVVKFGSHSLDVTTSAANSAQGAFNVYAGGAAIGSNLWSVGVWFLGTNGAGYTISINGNGGTQRATANFTGTGIPQYVTLTAQMVSDTNFVAVIARQARAGVESFWLGTAQFEVNLPTPFVGESGTTRAAGRLQIPSTLVSPITFAFAIRFRSAQSSAQLNAAGAFVRVLDWSDGSSSNELQLDWNGSTGGWLLVRAGQGGSDNVATAPQTFSANAEVTLVCYGTASSLGISVNGGAFVVTNFATHYPSGASMQSTINLGTDYSGGSILGATFQWVVTMTGTPTAGDVTTFGTFTSTEPTLPGLQGSLSAGAGPTSVFQCKTLVIDDMAPAASGTWTAAPYGSVQGVLVPSS